MRRRLNLFDQRKFTLRTISYVSLIRKISLWLFIILLVVNSGLGAGYIYFRYQEQKLIEDYDRFRQYVQANQDFSAEIQHFITKYSTLKTYLQQDAQSHKYFVKILDILNSTATQGQLSSFSINNVQEATFTIDFNSYEDAISFIDALERPLFQDAFTSIVLDGFSASDQSDSNYSLNLRGTFISIPTYGS